MKYFVIGALAIAVLVGGWLIVKNQSATDTATTSEQAATPETSEPTTTDPVATATEPAEFAPTGTKIAGNYYQYSQADYEAAQVAHRPIFLFFYANWCPTCAQQEPIVRGLMEEISDQKKLDDFVAFRINFNDSDTDADEQALAREFGVTYQHTMFVLDEDGNEYQKLLGQTSAEVLRSHFSDVVGL